nr:alpha isopropylmalate synthase [Tanacetum cinerariifolium]
MELEKERAMLLWKSGRHALKVELIKLGYAFDEKELDDLMPHFKSMAEKKKVITKDDLIALASNEVFKPALVSNEVFKPALVSKEVFEPELV